MKIIHCTLYHDNPYQQLLHSTLSDRYEMLKGTVDDAVRIVKREGAAICHVQWEEHILRHCRTAAEAHAAREFFLARLQFFRNLGGHVFWTVHNELPHELEFPEDFVELRRGLARLAQRVLVHDVEAVDVLRRQVEVGASRLFLLPHPSYLGVYEPASSSSAPWERPTRPVAMCFGKIRGYKGYEALLDALTTAHQQDWTLRIVGERLPNDPFADRFAQRARGVKGIQLDMMRVPDDEVAALLRSARCLVLPYERFLTSGVAMLGLTLGVPIVAPDVPQMRELLPSCSHELLFTTDRQTAIVEAISRATRLSEDEFERIRRASVRRANERQPERISRVLGQLYDDALAAV